MPRPALGESCTTSIKDFAIFPPHQKKRDYLQILTFQIIIQFFIGEEPPLISNGNLLHLGELLTCNAQGDGDQLLEVDASNKGTDSNQNPTKKRKSNHGFLPQIGLHQRDIFPTKEKMYKIHLNGINRLSKLKTKLEFKEGEIKTLQYLYKKDLFHVIERDLNDVTKKFIHSQLRNNNKLNTRK